MIPAPTESGSLPLGRYLCTVDEVEARFVAGHGPKRVAVWMDFINLVAITKAHLTVPAIWVGGSFITTKPQPADIDAVFLVSRSDGSPAANTIIHALTQQTHNLSVDSYILEYKPTAGHHPAPGSYLPSRGYWDDLWSRTRDNNPALDRLTRCGYLEVIIDGYS